MSQIESQKYETAGSGEVPIGLIIPALWRARGLILTFTVCGALLGALAWLIIPQSYTANAVIAPAPQDTSGLSSLSGLGAKLGSLTGISLGGLSDEEFSKYMQLITSTRLAGRLEGGYGFTQKLFCGWDSRTKKWISPSTFCRIKNSIKQLIGLSAWEPPTASDLAYYIKRRIDVSDLEGGGLLKGSTGSIEAISYSSKDPELAKQFLSAVLIEADALARQDRLADAKNRISYLKHAIDSADEIYLKDNLGQILQSQQSTLMVLQSDKFYAIDVIDPVFLDPHSTPRFATMAAGGIFLGLLSGVVGVFFILQRRLMIARGGSFAQILAPFPSLFSFLRRKSRA